MLGEVEHMIQGYWFWNFLTLQDTFIIDITSYCTLVPNLSTGVFPSRRICGTKIILSLTLHKFSTLSSVILIPFAFLTAWILTVNQWLLWQVIPSTHNFSSSFC